MTIPFKVYDDVGWLATCRDIEDAAAVVANASNGYIKYGRFFVWVEEAETNPAGDSFDNVAAIVYTRIRNGVYAAAPK